MTAVAKGNNILGTGIELITIALKQSYRVTALVRDETKLRTLVRNPNLVIIIGSPDVRSCVDQAMSLGQDAVVCCLGPKSPFYGDRTICSRAQPVINESMKAFGIKRLIAVSSQGVGMSYEQISCFQHLIGRFIAGRVLDDKERQEQAIQSSDLDYTIIRPGRLTWGPFTGNIRLNDQLKGGRISRKDLAFCIIKELSLGSWVGGTPTVNSY
ncbi:hypothetical protein BC937DRAFT_87121 [Endogone sp. FLAS-F59071]|nr:hypothetical protein BC937DRAFT_87121 [Endogone sp. FLAS-F59071]|eukprot:RUS12747.1 hypothetical protein BC937DRAFT_87121 [Endogone sp. FLAS-F59071]